ncbi:MAG: Imm42 family immunity protein [Planctomycetia bacterium]|nr:Imm42 family immunity protein [Planctomycetia bacterium]
MIFGNRECFAIETAEPTVIDGRLYSHFRFWIGGSPIGCWDDLIPLVASVGYMSQFCQHQNDRIDSKFGIDTPLQIFDAVYERFYRTDYRSADEALRRSRDVFHMDDIGMSSIVDQYGLVLVAADTTTARLVWKEWAEPEVIHDFPLPFGEVERVGQLFIAGALSQSAWVEPNL